MIEFSVNPRVRSMVALGASPGETTLSASQASVPKLVETLTAQGARIDTISGATFTSESYIESFQSAINRADL